jgi:uncharacterized protein (DUF2147 family)
MLEKKLRFPMAALCLAALSLLAFGGPLAGASDDAAASGILGNWLTQKHDGIIQITRTGEGVYQGQIIGGDAPERLDSHNPDPALRARRLIGVLILQDMQYDGQGRWSAGNIYDPDSGHTYRCRLEMRGTDSLRVRGFLGVSVLGRTQLWTRYRGTSLQLPVPPGR